MSVEFHDFEGCCTAVILTDFGQSKTSEYGYSDIGHKRLRKETIEQVQYAQEEGNGIVTAIITSQQTRAADVLKELGFIGTGAAQKTRHSEVTIELYYLHCKDWKAPEEPVEAPRPRDANGRFLPAQQEAVNPFVAPVVEPNRAWIARHPQWDDGLYVKALTEHTAALTGKGLRNQAIVFSTRDKETVNAKRAAANYSPLEWVAV